MSVEEGNKIIAEFENEGKPLPFPIEKAQYHISWDWLMDVVEKIKTSGDYKSKHYIINNGSEPSWLIDTIDTALTSIEIEATWLAVVEFLNWYNNQKQTLNLSI